MTAHQPGTSRNQIPVASRWRYDSPAPLAAASSRPRACGRRADLRRAGSEERPIREPGDIMVRRTPGPTDDKTPGKIATARAKIRAHMPELIAATPAWFPWLTIAGQEPASDR
jgi:hypothetical protein